MRKTINRFLEEQFRREKYQAEIYDVAVVSSYQRSGIGKIIMQAIVNKQPNCNFILYESLGKEDFYTKADFKRMKTGMTIFTDNSKWKKKGFTE